MSATAIAVEPFEDETIASMLRRLAGFLGVPVCTLWRGSTHRIIRHADLEALAMVLGIPTARLATHHLNFRRHEGRPLTGIDYRPAGALACPRCGVGTIWDELVLVSSCSRCELLLTSLSQRLAEPALPEALDLQQAFVRVLQTPTPSLVERFERVQRLHRIWRHQPWGTRTAAPWPAPTWVAAFAREAWPASATAEGTDELIATAVLSHLGGTACVQPPSETDRARLHRQLRNLGLAEANVPAYVNSHTAVLADTDETSDLGRAIARALRIEALHAQRGVRPRPSELNSRYGYNRDRPEIATYIHLLAHTADGLKILQNEATILTRDGVVDYAARRAGLRPLRRVPHALLAHGAVAPTSGNAQLAAAWIWTELTYGTLRESPHHAAIRPHLQRMNQALLPEGRLALAEYGHQFLKAVQDDVARTVIERPARKAGSDAR